MGLPRPKAVDATVANDAGAMILTVKLSADADGYDRLLWREAHEALRKDEEAGWRNLWANALGTDRVAPGRPGARGALHFYFSTGDQVYRQLVSESGLVAIVVVDRESSRFLSAKFLHRP